ncbi:MAG: effector-associated domain EAD1-containing protein [Pseudonocardiaceae bacterium]
MSDIVLSPDDLDDLLTTVPALFRRSADAGTLLRRIGYPAGRIPNFDTDHLAAWDRVFTDLAAGVIETPYRQLIAAALRMFAYNDVLQRLSTRYGVAQPAGGTVGSASSRQGSQPLRPAGGSGVRRVLVVGASPEGSERIRGDRELKEILRSQELGLISVSVCPAATVLDLEAVATFLPNILHLACHGDGANLIFEDGVGQRRAVRATEVVNLLATYRRRLGVQLSAVVLNSCSSATIAELFLPVAEVVIAHHGPLNDPCAVVFAGELYRALRLTSSLADAARIAAEHVSVAEDLCPSIKDDLVVLPHGG